METPRAFKGLEGKRLHSQGEASPEISPELLQYLRQKFSPHLQREADLRFYDRQVGQKDVIDHLERLWREQQKE